MYKYLLAWRYLRSRYIALVSIISVTLGVATMIVVNSVMSGFTTEMRSRIHGVQSDIIVESRGLDGFADPEFQIEKVRDVAGDAIEAITQTVNVPAMMSFQVRGQWIPRPVQLVGIDETTYGQVSDFNKYLQHPGNRQQMEFLLRENGYDTQDHQVEEERKGPARKQMKQAGWERRRLISQIQAERRRLEMLRDRNKALKAARAHRKISGQAPRKTDSSQNQLRAENPAAQAANVAPAAAPPMPLPDLFTGKAEPNDRPFDAPSESPTPINTANPISEKPLPSTDRVLINDLFAAAMKNEQNVFDPATQQHTGAVLGIAMTSFRDPKGADHFLALPGDDVVLTFPTAGKKPDGQFARFTIVDFYESKMSEYDSQLVFVPLRKLQELRGMIDPESGNRYATQLQIKLRPDADLNTVRDKLREAFDPGLFAISSWRDKQHALLSAVEVEIAILNILLFLIIAVAGFGILAIFLMIVVEKTRDIGILKALGASRWGVMGIFMGYGLSLGIVGSGAGTLLGIWFTNNINRIADWLSILKGEPIFNPEIYYFYKIPTIIEPLTIGWIIFGAIGIAVLSSILPALRAATLHPVKALRYE